MCYIHLDLPQLVPWTASTEIVIYVAHKRTPPLSMVALTLVAKEWAMICQKVQISMLLFS